MEEQQSPEGKGREQRASRGCARGCAVVGAVSFLIGFTIFMVIVVGILVTGGETEKDIAEKAEERRKGFHCLSTWDGHHDELEGLVRANLNDPGSMETYETRIGSVDSQGRHSIVMDFGARNAFGGMVRREASGWVDHETCQATLSAIE